MPVEDVMAAVHRLDLSLLSAEKVDILQRIVPGADEMKAFQEYERVREAVLRLVKQKLLPIGESADRGVDIGGAVHAATVQDRTARTQTTDYAFHGWL